MSNKVIDADGHVLEDDTLVDFLEAAPEGAIANRKISRLWPSGDHHHAGIHVRDAGAFGGDKRVGAEEWSTFVDQANLVYSALYPSFGLAMGCTSSPYWAVAVAKAYNDWLYQSYLRKDARLKGIALLPMQDVPSAVAELRRAVKELGMIGAMLPARGLRNHLGHGSFWPIYEEAERLGCALAVHGGPHGAMGFDDFEVYTPINGLGHPFGQMIAFSSLVFHGVFDEFPTLRVAFLEAGSAWVSLWMDRMDRSWQYHAEILPDGKLRTLKEKKPSDYFRNGRVFIGCEGSEESLPAQIKRVGNELFMFASDFPHEVTAQDCLREIDEVVESAELTASDKRAILYENAARFYAYAGEPAAAGAAVR
jgi:predicted TIM-barrel fold metal-dependent hydrolase